MLGTAGVLAGEPDADWVQRARADGDVLFREARHAAAAAGCAAGDPAPRVGPPRRRSPPTGSTRRRTGS